MKDLAGPASLLRKGRLIYVAESKKGRIIEININNGKQSVYASGLKQPEGMDFLPDGRIAVAEVGEKRIVAVSRGGEKEVLASSLPIGIEAPEEIPVKTYAPTGVAVEKMERSISAPTCTPRFIK